MLLVFQLSCSLIPLITAFHSFQKESSGELRALRHSTIAFRGFLKHSALWKCVSLEYEFSTISYAENLTPDPKSCQKK